MIATSSARATVIVKLVFLVASTTVPVKTVAEASTTEAGMLNLDMGSQPPDYISHKATAAAPPLALRRAQLQPGQEWLAKKSANKNSKNGAVCTNGTTLPDGSCGVCDTNSYQFEVAAEPPNQHHTSGPRPTPHSKCKKGLFIDVSPGAHGGESLNKFFKNNGFDTFFYASCGGRQQLLPAAPRRQHGLFVTGIKDDIKHGRFGFPAVAKCIRPSLASNRNVFIGDLKVFGEKVIESSPAQFESKGAALIDFAPNLRAQTFKLFELFELAFPCATFIWLARHPDKWATSLSHFYGMGAMPKHYKQLEMGPETNVSQQFLAVVHARWEAFHCAAYDFFHVGGRLGRNAALLNLDPFGFEAFKANLTLASGNNCLHGDFPHIGHHSPKHVYETRGANDWDFFEYLAKVCQK